jgi:hypothetical protein
MSSQEDLRRLLTQHEPEEVRQYLTLPDETTPRVLGSTVPLVGGSGLRLVGGQVWVPAMAQLAAPIDYVGVYVVLSEYFNESDLGLSGDQLQLLFASAYDRQSMLVSLALLNRMLNRPGANGELKEYFLAHLSEDLRSRLEAAFASEPHRKVLLSRQQLLAAMRYEMTAELTEPTEPGGPLDMYAIFLAHSVGDGLTHRRELDAEATEEVVGVPGPLFMELLRVGFLYQSDDTYSSIDRLVRLWNHYGANLSGPALRSSPVELLREATQLDLEDILALGFALFAHAHAWTPGDPPWLRPDMGVELDDAVIERFLRIVASDLDSFSERFTDRFSPFDFLPIQETPVLRAEPGLLVLDVSYLWERITSGLYWIVHDYERTHHGDIARLLWTQAYASMVEAMAEDEMRQMAPPLLGKTRSKTFFTEEDIREVFPGKQCDAAIDMGTEILIFEVVSGQMTVPTRIEGSREKFREDVDRLVLKKCRQLDSVAHALLQNEEPLTGVRRSLLRVTPVVVVGGGFPLNPFTTEFIEEALRAENLLQDLRILPLAVIDLGELEMLEGLAERGVGPGSVIKEWKESSLKAVSLRNFMIAQYNTDQLLRPTRMVSRVEETFESVVRRLGFKEQEHPDAELARPARGKEFELALEQTAGSLPNFSVPSREEWNRSFG